MSTSTSNTPFTPHPRLGVLVQLTLVRRLVAVTGAALAGAMYVTSVHVPMQSSDRLDVSPAPLASASSAAESTAGRDRWYLDPPNTPSTRIGAAVQVAERWYLEAPSNALSSRQERVDKDRWYRD